jgi:hypothetical protein
VCVLNVKIRAQEARLEDGELKFGMEEDPSKKQKPNPDLEDGKHLKLMEYQAPPQQYRGIPLEEVDPGIQGKVCVNAFQETRIC